MGGGFGRPRFFVPATPRKFPAVTIVTGPDCCEAVGALEGARILAAAAPALPMPGCSMPERCRCKFKKYVDRRDDEEGRRFRYGQAGSSWYAGSQRRKTRGRRAKD